MNMFNNQKLVEEESTSPISTNRFNPSFSKLFQDLESQTGQTQESKLTKRERKFDSLISTFANQKQNNISIHDRVFSDYNIPMIEQCHPESNKFSLNNLGAVKPLKC